MVTATIAAFALLVQLLLAPPCAQARPTPAPAHAHCQEAARVERADVQKAPASPASPCCKCVAASVALTPAPVATLAPRQMVAADRPGPCAAAGPSLRAIASGPPAQAPPLSI